MAQSVVYVSCGEGREIDVFCLDVDSGVIRLQQRLPTSGMPIPLRVRMDAGRLYAGMRDKNAVQSFSIDRQSGELAALGGVPAPGGPTYVMCDRQMHMLFSASYGANNLSVFPLDANGVPTAAAQMLSDLPRAHAAMPDYGNRWLLVPTLGADAIRIFRLGAEPKLQPNDPPIMLARSGSGPRHPVFSPDNRFVYCLNELDGHIDAFAFDAEMGALLFRQTICILPEGFAGAPWAAELRISPDGCFLYATDRRSSTIAVVAVDKVSGRMSMVASYATETQPRGMDLDSTGRWLVVAGQVSNQLMLYAIDPVTGRLTEKQRIATAKEPICVEIAAL